MITTESSSGEQVTRNSSSFKKLEELDIVREDPAKKVTERSVDLKHIEPRRSERVGRGQIDKFQIMNNNKSYI